MFQLGEPSYGKWLLFPGLRRVAMPGTVPRRAGHVLNLQPVALYSLVCCRCEMEISNNTDARMKFKRLKKKYGYAAKETLGNFRMSLFDFMWISGLPSPAQHRG